ncbi:MAG: dodecin family protein [Saprospiraceae bacterium]|jgi:flavin-binding protein dodecin|nr:dodecin family protein [Saprospiraceae bacterium]
MLKHTTFPINPIFLSIFDFSYVAFRPTTQLPYCLFFYFLKYINMSIVKVIEVISSSEISFDDAVQKAVAEVSKTIKNIDSVYVKDFKCHVADSKITSYGVICKVSFRVEN